VNHPGGSDLWPEYEAALKGAAFFFPSDAGYLSLRSADRISFLQRQTTNDLHQLAEGRSMLTVLTSPTARILDVLLLWFDGDVLCALPLAGRSAATADFLKSRIFFNDKVSLSDLSAEFIQVDLLGMGVPAALGRLGISVLPEGDQILSTDLAGVPAMILGKSSLVGDGWRLVVGSVSLGNIEEILAQLGFVRVSTEVMEILRVERGAPGAGRELSEAYTPLEVGLEAAVASQKGCYTGQEVIARQLTYGKVTRRLVGLYLDQPVREGALVLVEGKPAGEISSQTISPRFGAIALAVLKRPFHEPGTEVVIQHGDQIIRAVVTGLPFTKTRQDL